METTNTIEIGDRTLYVEEDMAIKYHLNDLPDCVLLKIFKYLGCKRDIWKARFVCIRWYNLLIDGELWRVSNLSQFKLNDINLMSLVKKSMKLDVLQFLEIRDKVITMDVLSVLLEEANQLYGLRLNGCAVKPGSMKLPYKLNAPYNLKFLDTRFSNGNLGFMEKLICKMGSTINVLGLSNSFNRLQVINEEFFLLYLPNLRVLECNDCTWINDESIKMIAYHCPLLESLNATRCLNIQGRTLGHLLLGCKNLKTLILRRTSIREEELIKPSWQNLKITELDLALCYNLNEDSVNKVVTSLAGQLEYLCCAFNDELITNITKIKKPLKCLELRRRHHVNLNAIVNFITTCRDLEALDISLAPIEHEFFEIMLPLLPKLKWISVAGHEILNTKRTLLLIAKYNKKIEEIQVNFYQSATDTTLVETLHEVLLSCLNLKKVCIEGAYMKGIVKILKEDIKADPIFKDVKAELSCKSANFTFPLPQNGIDKLTDVYMKCPSNANFSRDKNLLDKTFCRENKKSYSYINSPKNIGEIIIQ